MTQRSIKSSSAKRQIAKFRGSNGAPPHNVTQSSTLPYRRVLLCKADHETHLTTALLSWFDRNARPLPWRRSRDPYAIWVSEIMLQQTQVKTVLPYWERWMRALPDLASLARANSNQIHKLWEGLGYYSRVRNMHKAATQIFSEHNGRFPQQFEQVLALPGIGRYTAGAICSIAFNQPTPILDGNVIRVLARLYGIGGNPKRSKTNAEFWKRATDLVMTAAAMEASGQSKLPRRRAPHLCSRLNQALMELGALVCLPRQPNCPACPAISFCSAHRQQKVHRLPYVAVRPGSSSRRFIAFVLEKRGRFLVRQRAPGIVNAHLWEFPNEETEPSAPDIKKAANKLSGVPVNRIEKLCTIRHTITRYRITLDVVRIASQPRRFQPGVNGRWLTPRQLARLPFTSAHKQIVQRLLSLRD